MELRRNSQTHYWTIGLTQHGEISARPIRALIMGGAGNKPGKDGGGSSPRVTPWLNCRNISGVAFGEGPWGPISASDLFDRSVLAVLISAKERWEDFFVAETERRRSV